MFVETVDTMSDSLSITIADAYMRRGRALVGPPEEFEIYLYVHNNPRRPVALLLRESVGAGRVRFLCPDNAVQDSGWHGTSHKVGNMLYINRWRYSGALADWHHYTVWHKSGGLYKETWCHTCGFAHSAHMTEITWIPGPFRELVKLVIFKNQL